jgi:muramoyltetrapeptide carboxypeptidase
VLKDNDTKSVNMEAIKRRFFLKTITMGLFAPWLSAANPIGRMSEPTSILPKKLSPNALIGVLAPAASYFSEENLWLFLNKLSSMGYRYVLGKNVSQKYGYLAGSDKQRAEDFMDMIAAKEVEAIIAIRGGWGSARILPLLDFQTIRKNPKIIMGFSDITALLNAITVKTGLICYHGPVGVSDWENSFTLECFEKIFVKGEKMTLKEPPTEVSQYLISSGKAQGQIYGGNLSVLSDMIGTSYLPNWRGKILFLEDVTEDIFRIDRMLTQMRLAGIFDEVEGVVFASCDKCQAPEPEKSLTLAEVLFDNLKPCGKPAFFGLKVGHLSDKYIVPIGINVEINADEFSIKFLESPIKL